jgi:hypothetical protein
MVITNFWLVLAFVALPVLGDAGQASSNAGDLHAEIQKDYNFQPHTLSKAQITEKSAFLDEFWTKAKSQREVYLPGLRRELADFSNPPFFLFDGSQLLLSLSKDTSDRKIILAAIAHSDLRDLQWKDYFLLVQSMAAQGEDTTAAAFHILTEPKFQVFIPQHSLTLAQDYCLIYMLLPTNQDFWIQPAVERLRGENEVTAQKTLLLLLWYAQTPDSDKAVADFSTGTGKPAASMAYANELAHRKDSADAKTSQKASLASEESLRKARRERLKAVSDEALYDLDSYTFKIIVKRK